MLGWDIRVRREQAPRELPLASWSSGVLGLSWLDDLVRQHRAEDLGGNGYPKRYSMTAAVLFPIITQSVRTGEAAAPAGWGEQVNLERERMAACAADERLVLEAWDQS
jgi:hypothetical protein